MSNIKLGKLKSVDVRELWKHEQYDFSEWLSKKENINSKFDEGFCYINSDRNIKRLFNI